MRIAAIELDTAPVIVLVGTLAIAALVAVWLVPRAQARRWREQGIEAGELAELENGARSTLVQILGGVALILTFVATWLQIADARKASDRTLALTSAQQESERFTTAVQQLSSDKLEVRLGGIFGLEQAALAEPRRRTAVAGVMLAYLKAHHPLRANDPRLDALDGRIRLYKGNGRGTWPPCADTLVQAWPDTQAAFSVLVSLPPEVRGTADLRQVDLIGVMARGADLSGANLRGAALAGAHLRDADFDGALLPTADLRRACLQNARFDRASLELAHMDGADVTGATFKDTLLTATTLRLVLKHECPVDALGSGGACRR